MKTTAVILALAALAFAGCGSDGGSEKGDFETIENASALSDQASAEADLAIEALGQGDIETATSHVDEARGLAQQAQETLAAVESVPSKKVFSAINRLTLEGYEVLGKGIAAAGDGDGKATDIYIRRSLDIRKRKLQLINRTDFEAIGAGESNEKIRETLAKQLQAETGN